MKRPMVNPPDHMDHILAQWRRERPDLDVEPIGSLGRLFRSAHLADERLAEGIVLTACNPDGSTCSPRCDAREGHTSSTRLG